MGVDWIKFKLKSDVNLQQVRMWVERQSQNFAFSFGYLDRIEGANDDLFSLPPEEEAIKRNMYREACDRLEELIDFPNSDEAWDGESLERPLMRVYPITQNCIFPLEWRNAAYTTILPLDLPRYIAKWKNYLEDVKRGKYRNYLYQLFLFEDYYSPGSLSWKTALEDFDYWLEESYNRDNAWTKKEKFLKTREEVVARKIPNVPEIETPVFDPSSADRPLELEIQAKYDRYIEVISIANENIQKWNRCLTSKWRIRLPEFYNFEDYLQAGLESDWLHEFFEWCDRLIEEEYGLYLDY